MKSGDIGAVYVDTTSGSISNVYNSNEHDSSEAGTIMVIDANGNVNYDGALDKIQGRGNGTWGATNKRPFNIKLGVSTSLLGMSKAKNGVFLQTRLTKHLSRTNLPMILPTILALSISRTASRLICMSISSI